MAAIFPERPLKKLEADHALYRCYYDVPLVQYTAAAGISGAGGRRGDAGAGAGIFSCGAGLAD